MKTMKQEPSDPLDRLLAEAPMPKAPAWFEAKTLARLRREEQNRAQWPGFVAVFLTARGRFFAACAVGCTALLILGITLAWQGGSKPVSAGTVADNNMFDAFAAFKSVATEEDAWNSEGF
ncbi:MAG: hypothetical protein PHD76_01040 [Methylacidiphilales bacterium]|nr:hypothetical protein [Candidatus Methylacidiphilales bacterium]